jgi:hypothetical protein
MKGKQGNLYAILPITGILLTVILIVYFFWDVISSMGPLVMAIGFLGMVSFLGWFILDWVL